MEELEHTECWSLRNFEIRMYKTQDYASVESLIRELTRIFDDPFDPRWFKAYMEKRLLSSLPGCYVAVDEEGTVIGSAFCDLLRDPTGAAYVYISNIMIKKDFRGQGVGNQLLRACIEYAKLNDVPRIWANVREENENMAHLFKRHGFEKKMVTYEYKIPANDRRKLVH